MANKRSVILRGDPEINEEGVCGVTEIRPGFLVEGHLTLAPHSVNQPDISDDLWPAKQFALERGELGAGIDDTHQTQAGFAAAYTEGDTVKVGVFDSGDEVTAWVSSGEYDDDEYLTSNGDGALTHSTAGLVHVARSREHLVAADTGLTAIRVVVL